MKMSLVVEGVRSDVVSVADLGDETVAEVAERIAAVLERALPGRVLDLLSDAAAELSGALPDGRVEIRVAGDDVDLAYVEDAPVAPNEGDGELSARISLRLSERLKAKVEEWAAHEGVSVNSLIVRTLERGTSAQRSGTRSAGAGGTRVRGYGRT